MDLLPVDREMWWLLRVSHMIFFKKTLNGLDDRGLPWAHCYLRENSQLVIKLYCTH